MIKYFTGEIRRTSVYVFLFKANKSFMMYRVAGSWAITGLSLTSERKYLICAVYKSFVQNFQDFHAEVHGPYLRLYYRMMISCRLIVIVEKQPVVYITFTYSTADWYNRLV